MKLSVLIKMLQEEAQDCGDPDPEVYIMIGGRKPDEAELLEIPATFDCVHAWGDVIGILPDHFNQSGPPWHRKLLSEEETRAWNMANYYGNAISILEGFVEGRN